MLASAQPLFAGDRLPFQALPVLHFAPRVRVAVQLLVSALFAAVAYAVWTYTRAMFDATGSTGMRLPAAAEVPGWIYVVAPLVGLIAGAYVFVYLRFNFLQG
jgi:TRAP-type C4-dicarboxylate transport system permease small subunit